MKKSALSRSFSFALLASLCCSVCCMGILSLTAISRFREITRDNQTYAETAAPAKQLAAEFEREILNARISFIYFVTIQKPGSLQAGWKRYHQAEDRLNSMASLAKDHEELREMREPIGKLTADLQAYGVALASTLQMVQGGELKGSHFDAQVKEWAARGAVLVGDAATVRFLCLRQADANTAVISTSLHNGQVRVGSIFLVSFCLCLALTVALIRRYDVLASGSYGEGSVTSPAAAELEASPAVSHGALVTK